MQIDYHSESRQSRIQRKNRELILTSALAEFSQHGFRGATLAGIAAGAGLSKPNLLYYFSSKQAIYASLLSRLTDSWVGLLRALDPDGDPMSEILAYMRQKLEMSRHSPLESRLFATEILQGAPVLGTYLAGELRQVTDEMAAVLQGWMDQGKIRRCDPHHLIFAIWSLTQHYADFEVQVRALLGRERDPIGEAEQFLSGLLEDLLAQRPVTAG